MTGGTETIAPITGGATAHQYLHFEGHPSCPPTRARAPAAPVRPQEYLGLGDKAVPSEARAFYVELFRAAGLDATHYRDRALMRRLPACLRALQCTTIAEAFERIAGRPWLARAAASTVLLGVTEFFRDPAVFRFLDDHVLPALPPAPARPRIWSVACSDGQELYSVALLLAQRRRLGECELLGTDCRSDAIERAREGCFAPSESPPTSAPWPDAMPGWDDRREMPAPVRAAIRWKQADVLAGTEPGPWDIILCRNLSIYLEPEPAARLWATLTDQLAPGGYLIVGKADYPSRHLPLRRLAASIYRKHLP